MATKIKLIADNVITAAMIDTTATPTFGGITVNGDATVTGNLNITGDINSYNVTDLDVTDQTITLGAGQTEALSGGSGIIVDGSGASILWDETNDTFDFNKGIELTASTTAIKLVDADNTLVYHEIVNDSNTGLSIKVDQGDANGSSYFRTLIDGSEYLRLTPTDLELKSNIAFTKQDGMSISGLESLVFKINSAGGQTGRIFQFNDNTSALMTLDQDGDLGIGETSPVAKLHIQGTGTSGQVTSSFLLENASSGTAGMDITGAAGSSRLRLLYGGGPGTGTNNLTEALSVILEGSGAGGIQIPTHSGYEIKFTGDSNGANIVAESEMYFLSDENNNSNAQSLMAFGGGGTNGLYSTSKIKTSTGTNGSATAYSATSFGNNMGSTTIGNYNGIEPMAPFHILKGGLTMNGFATPGSVRYAHSDSDSGQWMHMNTMGRSGSGVGSFELFIPTAQTDASWGSFGGDLFLSGYNGNHEYIIFRGYTNGGLAGASAVVVTGTQSPTITVGQNGTYGFYIRVTNMSMTHPIAMYRICKGGNDGREWDLSEINGRWY